MDTPPQTPAAKALTDATLDLFRLCSRLMAAGDRLVADLGLTSARWHVLGALVAANRPQPVSWLARDMGGNRQNVQRIVNDLEKRGYVAFAPNPHHRRALLVVLTQEGERAFQDAMRLQAPWYDRLAKGLSVEEVETSRRVICEVLRTLDEDAQGREAVSPETGNK